MKRFAIAGVFALSAAASLAQQTIGESIEVRVVNVDVVVRDRAGKPVTGLTKQDFEIYENDKKQEITNLYEVHPPVSTAIAAKASPPASAVAPAVTATPEPAAEARRRNFLMFVDNYSLTQFRRDKILQSLLKFADGHLGLQDQIMLVLCTQQTKVITPFTNDRNLIRKGIESIKQNSSPGNRQVSADQLKKRVNDYIDAAKAGRFMTFSEAYKQSVGLVDSYSEEMIFNARNTLAALGQTTSAMAGMEGKNILIFAGAYLPEHPGSDLYLWLYNTFSPFISSLAFTTETVTGRSGSLQHFSIEEAAKQASVNGVALYIIDGADARDSISAENASPVDQSEKFASYTDTAMAYQTLARISGGVALSNTDNFDFAFETLATDINSYYSIGFKPANTTDTGRRTIVVKAKNPQYRARTRETYATKSAQDDMSARVIANINNSDARGAWQVELKPGTPVKEGSQYRVPFELSIAPTITLLPQDADLVGSFTVYIVVGSGGRTSKVITSPHPVKIPSEVEDQFRTMPMTYKAVIMMTPGENLLSVGIIDQSSNATGFARAKIVVP